MDRPYGFRTPLRDLSVTKINMVGLARGHIENAKVDGATDFQIFRKNHLAAQFPACASFAIFQSLDMELIFGGLFGVSLIDSTGETTVMTSRIVELLAHVAD